MAHPALRPARQAFSSYPPRLALLLLLVSPVVVIQNASAELFNESGVQVPAVMTSYADSLLRYYTGGIRDGNFDITHLEAISGLYLDGVAVDTDATHRCLLTGSRFISNSIRQGVGHYEMSVGITAITRIGLNTQRISYALSHVGPDGEFDHTELKTLYLNNGAIAGHKVETEALATPQCWESNTSRNPAAASIYRAATTQSEAMDNTRLQPSASNHGVSGDEDVEPIRSTGSNTWDLITAIDPSVLECTVYHGRGRGEIFDKRVDLAITHQNAFLFTAHYLDGTSIAIRLHPEFDSEATAIEEVQRYAFRLGQLPTILRENITRLAIMKGDETAMGDGGGEGIHIQSGNARLRESNNRLEETLFHEAVHTSLDDLYARTPQWIEAQQRDAKFLTTYGRKNPEREDFAESMLYVFALVHHEERLPPEFVEDMRERIPNRIAFIEQLLPPGQPIFSSTDQSRQACQENS